MIWIRTKQNRVYPAFVLILALFVFFSLLKSANAHRVIVYAWVDGNTVFVESKFNGGRKIKNGKVSVTDAQGNELLSGVTDNNGEFSFSIPKKEDLKIILDAGGGHRGEWKVPLEEIEGVSTHNRDLNQKPGQPTRPDADTGQTEAQSADLSNTSASFSQIELAVEKALDRKLKPIIKMLAESRQKGPTAKDIFAGIGYIVGLAGIAAYLRSRKKE